MNKYNKKSGQGLLEYALVLALLALICVAAVTNLGGSVVSVLYGGINDKVSSAQQSIDSRS